jgi:hypothetical protein
MFAKLESPALMQDVRSLLSAEAAAGFDDAAARGAFACVFTSFVERISGEAWAQIPGETRMSWRAASMSCYALAIATLGS